MYIIHAKPGEAICLGRQGEGNARQIVFDISHWVDKFGEGVIQLAAQRTGDADSYLCVVERDGSNVRWTIAEADTAKPGNYGKCELFYYFGNGNVRSEIWRTIVLDSMAEPSKDTPEPYQAYIDKMLSVGAYAEAERIKAETAAGNAGQSAKDAAGSASAALLDRQATEKAKGETETARDEALAAAKASGESAAYSEQSRLASEDAQKKAEQAAAETEVDAQRAENAREGIEQALTDTIAEREQAEAARDDAVAAADRAHSAAWVEAEINENGHLIVSQSDNFTGAKFAINESGNLEVSYE